MKNSSLLHIILLVVLSLIATIVGIRPTAGQSNDWEHFQEIAFDVFEGVVQNVVRGDVAETELAALRESVYQLEALLTTYHQQGACPSADAYESFRVLITTAQNVLSHPPGETFSPEEGQNIALLRQALHNYRSSGPAPSGEAIPASPTEPQLNFRVGFAHRPVGMEQFQDFKNGGAMRSGDLYKIFFIPGQNCYVYIFQTDSSGKFYGLFPLQDFRGVPVNLSNPVQAGQTYMVPGQKQSFKLDKQTGTERIYFLAYLQPNQELVRLYQEVVHAQNQGNAAQIEATRARLLKGMQSKGPAVIVSDNEDPEAALTWQEDGRIHSILQQRLEGACDGCITTLTFNHL